MKHLGQKLFLLAFLLLPIRTEAQSYNELQYIYARAAMGDVSSLQMWAARGGNLNVQDANGDTPYCMAIRLQNQTAVKALEAAGADTSARCVRSFSFVTEAMIYNAADDGDTKKLSQWQRYGVSPDVMDEDGNTALCEAVMKHNCSAIDVLLKAGANQYHSCLNRIPVDVRRTLDCKEVVRDWSKFGMTLLGGGAIAGLAVALSNGGGSDYQSCAADQHWNGKKCVSCVQDQYWDKTILDCRDCDPHTFSRKGDLTCTSCPEQDTFFNRETGTCDLCLNGSFSEGNVDHCDTCGAQAQWDADNRRCVCNEGLCLDPTTNLCRPPIGTRYTNGALEKGEYIDPETGYCKDIAPAPNGPQTYAAELVKYSPGGMYRDEYVANTLIPVVEGEPVPPVESVLDSIKAKEAYARGYTGYVVNRDYDTNLSYDDFGQLRAGSPLTFEQVKVAVLSSGMVTDINGVQAPGTTDEAHKYYVNPDFPYVSGQRINIGGGYNFDSGICHGDAQNCYYTYTEHGGAPIVAYKDNNDDSFAINAQTYEFELITEDSNFDTYLTVDESHFDKYFYDTYELTDLNVMDVNPHYLVSDPHGDIVFDATEPAPESESETSPTEPESVERWKFPQVGTQLAALIAAARNDTREAANNGILGVAFNAQIMPSVADIIHPLADVVYNDTENDDTETGEYDQANVIGYLTQKGADIILQDYIRNPPADGTKNLAIGAEGKSLSANYYQAAINAYNDLAHSNAVLVVPTGTRKNNVSAYDSDGFVNTLAISDAAIDAGAPLANGWNEESNLWGHFVSVTAVEPFLHPTNGIQYHLMKDALPCGSTGGYCLSAPGNTQATISPNTAGSYVMQDISGTHAAAAVVAGSIAILKGAYPHLTTPEVMEILYRTATPLGSLAVGHDVGVDRYERNGKYGPYSSLYGYGLVNLEAATRPVGPLWVNRGLVEEAEGGNIQYMPYAQNTRMTLTKSVGAKLLTAMPKTMVAYDSYNRAYEMPLTHSFISQSADRHDFEDDFRAFLTGRDVTTLTPNERFSMTYAPRYSKRYSAVPNGLMEMQLNAGNLQTKLFYTEDTQTRGDYFERVLNNPLIQLQEAYGLSSSYHLTKQFQIGASYTAGKNGFYGDGDKDFEAPENKISAFSVDMAYRPIKSVAFKTSYGLMQEDESVLGMVGEGNFALNGASTAFVGAGVSLRPTDKLKFDLMYTYGWTTPKSTDSLMRISKLTSDGFALTAQYQPDENQLFGFSFSSPLQVRSGKVSVALPTGRAPDSNTYYSQIYTANLKPTARELSFALFYKDKVTEDLTIQGELGLRLNPDHQADVETDYRGMFGLKYRY